MTKKKRSRIRQWLLAVGILFIALSAAIYWLVDVPRQAAIYSIAPLAAAEENTDDSRPSQTQQCIQNEKVASIDTNGTLNVLVWNVYKEQESSWQSVFEYLTDGRQLVLLQEALDRPVLRESVAKSQFFGNYSQAFQIMGKSSGVMSLSTKPAVYACSYHSMEPWLGLPKSAIVSQFKLSNGQVLAAVNVHGINFTVETLEYQQQLQQLTDGLTGHTGPIIFAGDFNTWSEERLAALYQTVDSLGMQEAKFSPDGRSKLVNGRILDHVFYRGLNLKHASATYTDASDHNPMLLTFQLTNK